MRRRTKYSLIVLVFVGIAVLARLALPYFVLDHVNDRLAALDGYDGHVEDIDIALWRGAYRVNDVTIVRENGGEIPFFTCERIDLAIEWRSLFKGAIVGTVDLSSPTLNLVQGEDEDKTQLGKGINWFARLEDLFPFRFNTVEVREGTVTFKAPGISSNDALVAKNVTADVVNLTNVDDSDREAFADFTVHGQVLGNAPAKIEGRLDPSARKPTFDVNLTLEKVALVQINPWLRAYAKVDAEGGTFELYSEVAAEDGAFKGYVKPLMQDVNIYTAKEDEPNPLRRLWEILVEGVAEIFENQQEEQVASLIPLSGTLEDPDAGVMEAIVGVLRNAFVGAFSQSLENTISLAASGKGDDRIEAADTHGKSDSDRTGSGKENPPEHKGPGPAFGPRS